MPELNKLKLQAGKESIERSVNLAKLSGSSPIDNQYIVWTCRPLVQLPTSDSDERYSVCHLD